MRKWLSFLFPFFFIILCILFMFFAGRFLDATVENAQNSTCANMHVEFDKSDIMSGNPILDPVISYENSVSDDFTGDNIFQNSCLSCEVAEGLVLSVGVVSDETDFIYLNPHFSGDKADVQYGLYLQPHLGEIQYSSDIRISASDTLDCKVFAITDRTYDTLVPVEYVNPAHYGVRWFLDYPAEEPETISIRIIRLSDGDLIGIAKLTISSLPESPSCYRLTSLTSGDAVACGLLTDREQDNLIESAVNYLVNFEPYYSLQEQSLRQEINQAVVEAIPEFYFGAAMSYTGEPVKNGSYSSMLFAVNLNYDGYGVITVYMAQAEYLWSTVPYSGDAVTGYNLIPVAYDVPRPFSRDTFKSMIVPKYLQEFVENE